MDNEISIVLQNNKEKNKDLQYFEASDLKRKIPFEKIEEAFQWHKLFQEGWITTHELSSLEGNATPEKEGELFKVETKNLRKIKKMMEGISSDAEFLEKLSDLAKLLPRPFKEMENMSQHLPHGDYNPTEHTLNALELLKVDNLVQEAATIARIALIFHDVGKVKNPLSKLHAFRSEKIARQYLQKMGFSSKEIQDKILIQIRCHDMLGEATRKDGENIFNERDLLLIFDNQQDLDIHYAITLADVGSIGGLSWALSDIEHTYNNVSRKMDRREQYLKESDINLPFERIDYTILFDLREKLFDENIHFDLVHKEQDELYRRIKFEGGIFDNVLFRDGGKITEEFDGVDEKEKEILEKTLIQSSLEGNRKVLFALKLMGRDTDINYAIQLEEKYNIELINLKIAMYMNRMTYDLWDISLDVEKLDEIDNPSVEHTRNIEKKLIDIKDSAEELAKYEIKATHATSMENYFAIKDAGYLNASNSTINTHFEGDGVYMGLFDSYKNWQAGEGIFNCTISLADTLPIMVDYRYPKAMTVVLSEYLNIFESGDLSIADGLRHWRQDRFDHNTFDWKVLLIGKVLNADIAIIKDEDNKSCVIIDTNVDPIVWGSLSRALKIRRVIPKSELKKVGMHGAFTRFTQIYKQENVLDYYRSLLNNAVKIKGVRLKDIVD